MNNSGQSSGRLSSATRNSDIFMALGVVAILIFMTVPLHSLVLDILLSFSITIAITILLVSMYILNPLELSVFPSLLLLTTLYRLSLNIASTRVILLHGNEGTMAAGKVIHAFGNFVVGGNYVVGAIVFLILVVINFVVITKGAGRIAEVTARFTLDAMPGKQMSIDADLNAGLIDEHEARRRRALIGKEADFYGAMDGASKFVRGDAIAGLIITLINIVGGFAIGIFQGGMSIPEAAQNYTLLTVGDGLISQIPALVISTAAGIVVTRAGSGANLGHEVISQIVAQPRAIAIAAAVLFGLGIIPGLPTLPFVILSIMAGAVAYLVMNEGKEVKERETAKEKLKATVKPPEQLGPLPPLDFLSLELGYGLLSLVDVEQGGELLDRIRMIRRQLAQDVGIVVPPIHIQDNLQLKPGEYVILLRGNEIARGELMTDSFLAMNPGPVHEKIEGIPTNEPTYGLPALWINENVKERALGSGYTVVDSATVLTTHLSDVLKRHAHESVGRQEVQQLLDKIKETHPKVVEELIPHLLPLGGVVKVLQNLLREQVPIRDILTILEALADCAAVTKDVDTLTEYTRQCLARTITKLYQSPDGTLPSLTVDQSVERAVSDAMRQTEQGNMLVIEPGTGQRIIESISKDMEKFWSLNYQPILLCSAHIRLHLKRFIDRFIPNVVVLSYNEIVNTVKIQSLGTVGIVNADQKI
ncbi:MAG: flagellar biosynthesis protein FlhA [Deltaproteobacteria bacterium]|nr:flagellar biosynthesis protein FlhA [Deltaproteobacteria bacterium]